MATRIETYLIDDLDGSDAAETIAFSLDGVTYEMELSADNAQNLRETLAGFTKAARKTVNRRQATRTTREQGSGPRTSDVRAWARNNGLKVNSRGRLDAAITAAYEKANAK
jgi:hypothetical protein